MRSGKKVTLAGVAFDAEMRNLSNPSNFAAKSGLCPTLGTLIAWFGIASLLRFAFSACAVGAGPCHGE